MAIYFPTKFQSNALIIPGQSRAYVSAVLAFLALALYGLIPIALVTMQLFPVPLQTMTRSNHSKTTVEAPVELNTTGIRYVPAQPPLPYPLHIRNAADFVRVLRKTKDGGINENSGREEDSQLKEDMDSIESQPSPSGLAQELVNAVDFSRSIRKRSSIKDRTASFMADSHTEKINSIYDHVNFTTTSVQSCNQDLLYNILILIRSHPNNGKRREGYRTMWTKYLNPAESFLFYGFLLGENPSDPLNPHLEKEIELHKDLIIGDFADTSDNLIRKVMMGFKWAVERCPNFLFYVSLDDDMYLSVERLKSLLLNPFDFPGYNAVNSSYLLGEILDPTAQDFYGGVLAGNLQRLNEADEEYPLDVIPEFVQGGFVLYSWKTLQDFYYLSPYVKELRSADLYQGLLANKLAIGISDMSSLVFRRKDILWWTRGIWNATKAARKAMISRTIMVRGMRPHDPVTLEFLNKYH